MPAFPEDGDLFADGANWQTGHWLNGRLGAGTQADIIAAVLTDNGFANFDVGGVSGDLTGYVQADVTSARELLEPILQAFQIGCVERGGVLTFFSRAKRSAAASEIDVVADIIDEPLWQEKRGQESDLAGQAILDHFDQTGGYERVVARSRKVSAASDRILRAAISGVMAETSAAEAAEELLRDHRIQRRTLAFRISPTDVALEPGDMVSLPDLDGTFLVSRIEDGEDRKIEAGEYVPLLARRTFEATARRSVETLASSDFSPILHLMDLPKLGTGAPGDFARGAVFVKPWRTVRVLSSSTQEGYAARAVFEKPATVGTLMSALGSGVSSRFDHSQALQVKLSFGSLASADEAQVLAGTNRLALLSDTGAWEVISFLNAEETGSGEWTLTGLLRGQFGTEDAMEAGASSGNAVVLLNDAIKSLGLDDSELGRELNWIAEAGARRSASVQFAGGSRAATPLCPVHLSGKREAGGAIALSWIRRGRDDANNWTAFDIPLDEPEERYLLDILSGETTIRSVEVEEAAYTYSGADELTDFGSMQNELSFRVRQLGWTVAQGFAAEKIITL